MKRAALYALAALWLASLLLPALLPPGAFEQNRENALAAPSLAHPLGTDTLGRDILARTAAGARLSLSAGLLATAFALALATALGAWAGLRGGWPDQLLMRLTELFQAMPWFYLLLGVRALLPLSFSPEAAFLAFAALLGVLGWARPARLIRGVVLSARERDYVQSARAFGASPSYLLRRHILPEAAGVIATQAALLFPRFIVAEVTLSFFGLGLSSESAGLGQMLAGLRDPTLLAAGPWVLAPAVLLLGVSALSQAAADESGKM